MRRIARAPNGRGHSTKANIIQKDWTAAFKIWKEEWPGCIYIPDFSIIKAQRNKFSLPVPEGSYKGRVDKKFDEMFRGAVTNADKVMKSLNFAPSYEQYRRKVFDDNGEARLFGLIGISLYITLSLHPPTNHSIIAQPVRRDTHKPSLILPFQTLPSQRLDSHPSLT